MKVELSLWISVICLVLLFGCGGEDSSGPTFIPDQDNAAFTPSGFQSIQALSPIGQEFTPTLSSLDFVELFTEDFGDAHNGVGGELVVNIRHGTITDSIIATSLPVTLPDSFSGITHFNFPSSVSLTPGEIYIIEITVASGDNWGVGMSGVPTYAGGGPILQGVSQTGYDLWFKEGHTVP